MYSELRIENRAQSILLKRYKKSFLTLRLVNAFERGLWIHGPLVYLVS